MEICILTRSPGDTYAHSSSRGTDLEDRERSPSGLAVLHGPRCGWKDGDETMTPVCQTVQAAPEACVQCESGEKDLVALSLPQNALIPGHSITSLELDFRLK